jgi:hypothetical protein
MKYVRTPGNGGLMPEIRAPPPSLFSVVETSAVPVQCLKAR